MPKRVYTGFDSAWSASNEGAIVSAILDAGGFLVSDAWIHPTDLVAIGLLASEEMAES